MRNALPLLVILVVLVGVVSAPRGLALAHGANLTYTTKAVTVIEITATFDTGEPMRGAQVAIFAPDDPRTPWQTGLCDEQGRFSFTPDRSRLGTWEVRVRQAGHGAMLYLTIDEPEGPPLRGTTSESGDTSDATGVVPGENSTKPWALQIRTQGSSYTPLQYVLMAGCVIWGFVGTALYFSRGSSPRRAYLNRARENSRPDQGEY